MRKLIPVICIMLLLAGCVSLSEAAAATPAPAVTTFPSPSPIPTPIHTPVPSPSRTSAPSSMPMTAIELVAQAALPDVETGNWYEWDIAGIYPRNLFNDTNLYFIEAEDTVIRTVDSDGSLVASRLDGAGERVLDEGSCWSVNCFNDWVYYLKQDGIWKVRTDGTGEQQIISFETDSLYDKIFIYDGYIYLIQEYEESIIRWGLDGNGRKAIDVPDVPDCGFFISDDCIYYGANTAEAIEYGPDSGSIWRYNLSSGAAKKLVSDAYGLPIVRDGMVYYLLDDLVRTDGVNTEHLISDPDFLWDYNYNLYRNYLFCFKDTNYGDSGFNSALCALNVDTGKEYALFEIADLAGPSILSTENSVFLGGEPLYRITFEGGQAYLWRLNGLT